MKKLIIAVLFVLSSLTLSQAADKWTGPISPIDPMWGFKGSSIMAEALRDRTQEYQQQQRMKEQEYTIYKLQRELDDLKKESRGYNRREW